MSPRGRRTAAVPQGKISDDEGENFQIIILMGKRRWGDQCNYNVLLANLLRRSHLNPCLTSQRGGDAKPAPPVAAPEPLGLPASPPSGVTLRATRPAQQALESQQQVSSPNKAQPMEISVSPAKAAAQVQKRRRIPGLVDRTNSREVAP